MSGPSKARHPDMHGVESNRVGADPTVVATHAAAVLVGDEHGLTEHRVTPPEPLYAGASHRQFEHFQVEFHSGTEILVDRLGELADALDAHPGSIPVWFGAHIAVPDGWEANQVVLERSAP